MEYYAYFSGGQIEFQELLPLLVAGHAIFVFLFPLNVDLDKPVTVSYRKKVRNEVEHSNVYESSLTINESFTQTLASIDSMESNPDLTLAKHKPYVFVVGTHKDCLVKELGEEKALTKIAEIDSQLKSLISKHRYGDLVVFADKEKEQVSFAVDNTSENDIFVIIRRSILDLLHSGDEFRVQFPLSYLLASLHLQNHSQPFISRSEFAGEVAQYGIEEDDVDQLLQFLHTRIGQIRHFPVGEIREVITNEPQALYNFITHLITKGFTPGTVTMAEFSEVQRGIYSRESFDISDLMPQLKIITPEHVIELLKELRIVAPFYDRKAKVKKFFIPCILNHLNKSPPRDSLSIVQPLTISFECGHCPKGLFGVLLHCILTQEKQQLNWSLDIDKIFRDQVSFDVGPYNEVVTIKFRTTHLEILFSPEDVPQRNEAFSFNKICNMIRCAVLTGIEQARKSLHYSEVKTKHNLGLVCSECDKVHKVIKDDSQRLVKCPQIGEGYSLIPDPASFWFGGKSLF